MKRNFKIRLGLFACLALWSVSIFAQQHVAKDSTKQSVNKGTVVDEVIWVVGDEPILRSDVEVARLDAAQSGMQWKGDPDCAIPEQLAVQKLFLHQAAIDSLEVTESELTARVDEQLEAWIQMAGGSREKLEEYKKQPISQLREQLRDALRDRQLVQRMREKIVSDVAVTPADVRKYFKDLPADSIPFVPTEVEVQVITNTPKISQEEINRVKDELRGYTDRINKGDASFATLARLYSEDPGSARRGGELGYMGRGVLDPAFAAVAFNLTDPTKVSKIVESEFGYHIIQLIDKRGDKVNVRHILLKPTVSTEAINASLSRLDSIRNDIVAGKFTFDDGASVISDDKDTRYNKGLMANSTENSRTSKFRMQDLPSEVASAVDGLKVGEVSKPFQMINQRGKTVCAIAKLKSRVEGHKATITEDFQAMKDIVESKMKEDKIHKWVSDKIKSTYVRVNEAYKNCKFEYQGWIK
jgi:peptidyl-prolyl cis-trans isomerase SurA